jgi:hypothetical protein
MTDILLDVKYSIDHDEHPKRVVCRVTVGLPLAKNQGFVLEPVLYDNQTEFLEEVLTSKWGNTNSRKSDYHRFVTYEIDCNYTVQEDGTCVVTSVSLAEIAREFLVLEKVIQRNLRLSQALPSTQEFRLPILDDGRIDLTKLC